MCGSRTYTAGAISSHSQVPKGNLATRSDFECDVGYVLADATAPGVSKEDGSSCQATCSSESHYVTVRRTAASQSVSCLSAKLPGRRARPRRKLRLGYASHAQMEPKISAVMMRPGTHLCLFRGNCNPSIQEAEVNHQICVSQVCHKGKCLLARLCLTVQPPQHLPARRKQSGSKSSGARRAKLTAPTHLLIFLPITAGACW